ncbi:uncharacterized protein LOC128225149 [Mya arenaria]|nr:uncharacterized protein LOC128225149 [Mya arenaria]
MNFWSTFVLRVLATALLFAVGLHAQSSHRRGRFRSGARIGSSGLPNHLRQAYDSAVSVDTGVSTTTSTTVTPMDDPNQYANSWNPYTPTLPAPENVDCYIDVQITRRQGGRCVQLGGENSRPYICQSGPHIDFAPRCRHVVLRRQQQQQQLLEQQQQQSGEQHTEDIGEPAPTSE